MPDAAAQTRLSVSDLRRAEGDGGSSVTSFRADPRGDVTGESWVTVASADGTAQVGTDYTALAPTTVHFAHGQEAAAVIVPFVTDTTFEKNETLSLNLSSPVGASISDASAVATIVNDNPATYLSVGDASLTEGDSGTTNVTFRLTRTGSTAATSSVVVQTVDGSATAGPDYTARAPKALTFAAGQTTRSFVVSVTGDPVVEADEKFAVRLSAPVGAVIADPREVAHDRRRRAGEPLFGRRRDGHRRRYGSSSALFTLTRTGSTAAASSMTFATSNGSAIAGSDCDAQFGHHDHVRTWPDHQDGRRHRHRRHRRRGQRDVLAEPLGADRGSDLRRAWRGDGSSTTTDLWSPARRRLLDR